MEVMVILKDKVFDNLFLGRGNIGLEIFFGD
jgi:hypothetical protein